MKKINLGFYLFALFLTLWFACKKHEKEAAEPVTPSSLPSDTALQSSKYATHANFLASDIEMICSFIGEGAPNNTHFYYTHPSSINTITVVRDLAVKRISITFNQTTCNDGRIRDGSIFMFYQEPAYAQYPITGNENYIRDYNYTGRITLEEYRVDGWLIDEVPFSVFIKNLRPNSSVPVQGNLQWSFEGDLKIKKNQDSMTWKGKYNKTLENTSNASVFNPNAQSAINWSSSIISYTGTANGTTFGNVPFTYQIDQNHSLKRDFLCSPDALGNPSYTGFHPFISGIVSFTTTGASYTRKISYGNIDDLPFAQCDNQALVQINKTTYTITMRK